MHHRPMEPLIQHPTGVPPQSFRRFEHFDVAPPGTGPDIPGIGSSYEKPRYERSSYENRSLPLEDFLTPPGVDHRYRDRDRDIPGNRDRDVGPPGVRDRDIGPPGNRDRDVGMRDRDMGMSNMRDRDRDIAPPGVRDRDLGVPLWDSRERGTRDDLPPARDPVISRDRDMVLSDRSRDKDRNRDRDVRERDGDRDRDRGRGDYYENDHRRSYDKGYGSYNSPDMKKRKQSLSPGPGRHERYSSSERHHRRGSDRRKSSGSVQVPQTGKENRHMSQQQPVETVVDAVGGQREREKDTQKRERVLVEVRKEPSVDRLKKDDKGKKEEDSKKGKDKKKKKKEKEPEGEKLKKKRRKEKKEGKREGQDVQEKIKVVVKGTERKVHHKEKNGEERAETEENKVEEKPAVVSAPAAPQEKKVLNLASGTIVEKVKGTTLRTFDAPPTESIVDSLYGDMEDTRIDGSVIASYGKVIVEEVPERKHDSDSADRGAEMDQEVGDGVESRVKTETASDSEAGTKPVTTDAVKTNVMLAPMPEPSKWELEEEFTAGSSFEKKESEDGAGGGSQADKGAGKVVTSEVLKRAENAIFQKAINAIRPIEPPKKVSSDRKVYAGTEKRVPGEMVIPETVEPRKVADKDTREARKTVNSIQITIPTVGHVERSVEIASLESSAQPISKGKGKLDRSKFSSSGSGQWGDGTDSTSPLRVPAKERLGARVDGDTDRKKDDSKESKRQHSRSESRERKHSAAKKGLKSAVEKKHTLSRSRSRSPHHRKESKYAEEVRRYDSTGDRRYGMGDSRSKRGERESRYADIDRERRPLDRGGIDSRRRDHSESKKWEDSREKKEIIKSPERRRERSGSHEAKVEKNRSRLKEEREKSIEKGKARHKAKKKTKNRSESRSRKKSVSDRESKRGKKKDKKHKKEKGKKHKQRDEKTEKKESESGKEKEEERDEKNEDVKAVKAVKAAKADMSNEGVAEGCDEDDGKGMGTSETAEQSKDKPKKGGRRNPRLASDRKKSTLDEASFEPDYDASSSVDTDADDGGDNEKKPDASSNKKPEANVSPTKKRDRSASTDPAFVEQKRQRLDKESDKSDSVAAAKKANSKLVCTKIGSAKKRDRSVSSSDSSDDDSSDDDDDDSSSGSSSSSDDDSSDDSSVHRRRKKKSHHRRRGKRSKKSARRTSNSSSDSESESESVSTSDSDGDRGRKGGGRSSKKHKHKNRLSKKKKKSSKHR